MQKSVVVTLVNADYVERAKQLFSSLYYNAKWPGNCALMHYGVSETDINWFKRRGIITIFSPPLHSESISRYAPIVSSKLYLFHVQMKRWKTIVYLDTDVIVRKPINSLTEVKQFSAVPEKGRLPLRNQFVDKPTTVFDYVKLWKLSLVYNFNEVAFNAGVLAFPTSLITHHTMKDLSSLLRQFASVCKYSDQGIQNLYFYKRWESLSEEYNMFPKYAYDVLNIHPKNNSGIILHFADEGEENKPWHPRNYFFREWLKNLKKADRVSFSRRTT